MSFENSMKIAEMISRDDVMNSELRAFICAVKCVMKSAETGKGLYLAVKRHIPFINEYVINSLDVTGTIQEIVDGYYDSQAKVVEMFKQGKK